MKMRAEIPDFEDALEQLTPFLLEHGWMFPPMILGGELAALWNACEPFRTGNLVPAARRRAEETINSILVHHVSRPNTRAYSVWLSMQMPFVETTSHLIEAATLHYFRRDFLSCVHLMLPAIEGTVRRHYAHHVPNPPKKLTFGTFWDFVRGERPVRSYPVWHRLHRGALAEFLKNWLWPNTKQADFELSHLNRHYALHGLGEGAYYRSEDCHRLFIFLDVYLAMLVLETGVGQHVFIPDEPTLTKRAKHYEGLLVWNEATRTESRRHAFLREHRHYHYEEPKESLLHQVLRWAKLMGLDRKPHAARAPSVSGSHR